MIRRVHKGNSEECGGPHFMDKRNPESDSANKSGKEYICDS